jgi:hypothetical protein
MTRSRQNLHNRHHLLLLLAVWFGVWTLPHPVLAQDGSAATPTNTPVAPPDAPLLLAPGYGATTTVTDSPPLAMPTLAWVAPLNANIYHVQIADSPGFATILQESDTYGTTFTPTGVWPDALFYWRVRAGNKAGSTAAVWGSYSEAFVFQKNWSSDTSNRPVPISPAESAERSTFLPTDFSWTAVVGAAGYKLEIATDDQFSNIVYSAETIKPHHTPTTRLAANDAYYWRVTPFAYFTTTANRVNGTVSTTTVFKFAWSTPPLLLEPPAQTNQSTPELRFVPRFSWTAVEGAEEYELQISTDQSFATSVTSYKTRNTDLTPVAALANDKEYFWRVKAINYDDYSTTWSEIRSFHAAWNQAPQLLTPANGQTKLSYPFFSWTPVPGAERYQIHVLDGDKVAIDKKVYNVTYFTQANADKPNKFYSWRVRGIDAHDNYTPWSETRSFRMELETSPQPIYPAYYYTPDSVNMPVAKEAAFSSNVVFVWDAAHRWEAQTLFPVAPDYYLLEVASDLAFTTPIFTITTAGLAAAPTIANPMMALIDGQMVYWRVSAIQGGTQFGVSIVSQARYRASAPDQLLAGDVITPIYPQDGMQVVETPPVLGWLPVNGASNYAVQISRRPDFAAGAIVDSAQPQYVNYAPWQGRTAAMPAGAYWWRVRAESSPGVPLGDWNTPRRFDLARDVITGNPFEFVPPFNILSPTITYNPIFTYIESSAAPTGDEFDLTNLHVMLDRAIFGSYYWYLAFGVADSAPNPVSYILYVDVDHVLNSGAAQDPTGQPITIEGNLRPEYAVHAVRQGDAILSATFYAWSGDAWQPAQPLANIGGMVSVEVDGPKAVHLRVPYATFNAASDNFSGSLGLAVISVNTTLSGQISDSIPQQGALYGAPGMVDNMTTVSDMVTPLFPFDTPLSNPFEFQDMPPLRWRMPHYDSVDGYRVQVAKDANFSQIIKEWDVYENLQSPYFGFLPATFTSDAAMEDNASYYWRARIRHEKYDNRGNFDFGPWSPAMRFKLSSRLPGNPTLSTGNQVFMTPTFLWERVEGAGGYTVQIDNDANFSTPLVNQKVDGTSYTPQELTSGAALLPGTQYYWRLAMRRSDVVYGQWTPTMVFQKASVSPAPIAPSQNMTVTGQPTFEWSVVLTPTTTPRLATPRYHLQVDDDLTFGSPLIDIKTTTTSYTPIKGKNLADGIWYWRVALTDANGNDGPFSPTVAFQKQYLAPNLIAPFEGGTEGNVPVFTWEPVGNAAYYELTYANNPAFTNATKTATMSSDHTPTKNLSKGRYYWYVQMFDQDKNGGPIIARYFDFGYSVYLPLASKPTLDPIVEPIVFDYYRSTGCTGAPTPTGVTAQTVAAPITGIGVKMHILNSGNKILRVETLSADGQTPSYSETLASNDEQIYLIYSNEYETGEVCVASLPPGAYSFRVYVNNAQLATGSFTIVFATAAGETAPDQTPDSVLKVRRIGQSLR